MVDEDCGYTIKLSGGIACSVPCCSRWTLTSGRLFRVIGVLEEGDIVFHFIHVAEAGDVE